MDVNRLFELLVLAEIGCLLILAFIRGMLLIMHGTWIFPIDRKRTKSQQLSDIAFLLCFLLCLYETFAIAIPLPVHLVPASLRLQVIDSIPAKALGALAMTIGNLVYGLALRNFGASWRFSIDRDRPGPLVTGGIFARSRNPVYLGLTLVAAGVTMVLGQLILVLLVILWLAYCHFLVLREERFLSQHYGEPYRAYARHTRRWWTWRNSI